MQKNTEEKIFNYLQKHLSPKRFEHSYNVAEFAVELAGIYGADGLKAQTAGLLHDCAKSKTDKQLISFLKNRKSSIKYFKDIKKYSPQLLHAYAGAVIAKEKLGITDVDILNAIRNHTLGRQNMSMLEKIIFVSDAVSFDRKSKELLKIRKLALKDFEKAFFKVMARKIQYVLEENEWLCPQALDTWNYYVTQNKKNS
ncbi:MAG: bis(5'-nucleosyl)-tetraphosphatase (symmetrical) YqeK [Endomicrobia bacterium]|nr:bis(5'-nucleosyl)-tetraphosphatase (symmetrical) YqeK [Endomicrobiia bacterium]MCL2506190.1 bis(5'-nucleosyl)-tetraphosphatase (symmetrical) YqeK [Endomicrobiia bacterium]